MAKQARSKNMCSGCKVPCCTLMIPLTSYDVVRIMQQEGKKPESFMVIAEDAYGQEPDLFRAAGKRLRFLMKSRGTGHCVFHDRAKRLKCTIESSKPAVCLAYPMELSGGKPSVRLDAVCPAENRKIAAGANKMSKKVLDDSRWEVERYREIVGDWNALASGWEAPDDFFNFALGEMELERTRVGSARRKVRRVLAHWFLKPGYAGQYLRPSKRR